MSVLERWTWPAWGLAFYASGWVVTATSLPASWRLEVASVLVVAGAVAVLAAARAVGIDLSGGRCKARTTDGPRCRLSRRSLNDLCHVHQRTHDVELHPSAIDGTVATAEVVNPGQLNRVDEAGDE